jgi:hypothetical protein
MRPYEGAGITGVANALGGPVAASMARAADVEGEPSRNDDRSREPRPERVLNRQRMSVGYLTRSWRKRASAV